MLNPGVVQGVRQNQSLFRVLEVAKRVIKEALPIKCVEAVYLGIYLTQSMTGPSPSTSPYASRS